MPKLGDYELERQIWRTPTTALWRARKTTDPGATVRAIKEYFPAEEFGWDAERIKSGVEAFLTAAAVQKKVAAVSPRWAPIEEAHEQGGAAYYVTPFYSRSIRQLIEGRVRISCDELRHIVCAVIEGLQAVQSSLGRGHGNLKPSNILISGASSLATAGIRLTDPAPGAATEAQDLKSLAHLIHELVTYRPSRGRGGKGAEALPEEWQVLGRESQDWRTYYARLIVPGHADTITGLDKAMAEFPRRRTPLLQRPIVLIPILLLMTSIAVLLFRTPTPVPLVDEWPQLCHAYRTWFEDISDRGTGSPLEGFEGKNKPKEVIRILREAKAMNKVLNPRAIANMDATADLRKLEDNTPQSAMNGTARKQTHEALAVLNEVDRQLHQWEYLKSVETAAPLLPNYLPAVLTNVGQRPFSGLVNKMISYADAVPTYGEVIRQLQASQPVVEKLLELKRLNERLGDTSDPVLMVFPEFVANALKAFSPRISLSSENETAIDRKVNNLIELAKKLSGQYQRVLAHEKINQNLSYPILKNAGLKALTEDDYSAWLQAAVQYEPLGNDRNAFVENKLDTAERLKTINVLIQEINDTTQMVDPEIEIYSKRSLQIASKITDGFKSDNVKRDEREVRIKFGAMKSDLIQLSDELRNKKSSRGAEGWLSGIRKGDPVFASKEVDAAWSAYTRSLLLDYTEQRIKTDSKVFDKARDEASGIMTRLKEVDTQLSDSIEDDAKVDPNNRPWTRELSQVVTVNYRNNVIREACKSADLRNELLTDQWASRWKNLKSNYESQRKSSAHLLDLYIQVEDGLRNLWDPKDKSFRKESSLNDLYAQCKALQETADSTIKNAIYSPGSPAVRMEALQFFTSQDDAYKEGVLRKILGDATPTMVNPELLMQAMRMSDALPLSLVKDVEKALLIGPVRSVANRERRYLLIAQVKDQSKSRYISALSKATENSMPSLFKRMEEFDFTVASLITDKRVDPRTRYNLLLLELQSQTLQNPSEPRDEDLRLAAGKFAHDVETHAAGPAIQPIFVQFKTATQPSSATPIPMAPHDNPDYTLTFSRDGQSARLTLKTSDSKNRTETLEFLRVQGESGRDFYLATTETSVGFFLQCCERHWAGISRVLYNPEEGNDDRGAPRAWDRSPATKLPKLASTWVKPDAICAKEGYYPPALRGKNSASLKEEYGGDPTLDHPIQYVSPRAAMYVAVLVGCRLPTAAEWTSAYKGNKSLSAAGPVGAWNQRDQTWLMQRDYCVAIVNKHVEGLAPAPPYPSENIFRRLDVEPPGRGDEKPVHGDLNDHLLWFDKVRGDSRAFHHLVGNVAEYVFEDFKNADKLLLEKGPGNISLGDIEELLTRNAWKDLGVIGGSALSPPEVDPGTAYPVDPTKDGIGKNKGYSDVGFRLAFSQPNLSPRQRLLGAIKSLKYLSPPE